MKSDVILPKINTNDNDVEIVKWHVEDFALVEKGADLVEVSTSKAVVILEASAAGYVKRHYNAGSVVAVGKILASIFGDLNEAKQATDAPSAGATPSQVQSTAPKAAAQGTISMPASAFGFSRLSKEALNFAKEHGIDPKQFIGAGLVSARSLTKVQGSPNVMAIQHQANAASPEPARPQVNEPPPDPSLRSEKVGRNKKFEITALTAGQAGNINSSITTQFNSDKVRATLKSLNVLNGQMLPLILFELARLLETDPRFTSFFHNDSIYFYDKVNIGVAIDLGEGLKVGVIKDVNKLMPIDIYKALTDYSMKYMRNKLTIEESSGGTVTVTDLSGDNVLHFQPLINQNQTIIFGFGGDGSQAGHPMTITGVFDHRVLSGRDVSNFLNELKKRILAYESQNFSNLK